MPPDFSDNPFADFLESSDIGRRAAFFGRQPQDLSFNEQRLFENQFGRFQNQFLGRLGRQIQAGEPPTARFDPFLEEFDFNQQLGVIPPALRGVGTAQFAPPTLFGF